MCPKLKIKKNILDTGNVEVCFISEKKITFICIHLEINITLEWGQCTCASREPDVYEYIHVHTYVVRT